MNPTDLQYTAEHEWVRAGEGNVVRFGITEFAQDALGDIVFVTLPEVGQHVSAGQPCGEVESTKSVSDIFAPVTGTVTACNEAVENEPGIVNADPYGRGWLVEVTTEPGEGVDLMDASQYEQHIAAL